MLILAIGAISEKPSVKGAGSRTGFHTGFFAGGGKIISEKLLTLGRQCTKRCALHTAC